MNCQVNRIQKVKSVYKRFVTSWLSVCRWKNFCPQCKPFLLKRTTFSTQTFINGVFYAVPPLDSQSNSIIRFFCSFDSFRFSQFGNSSEIVKKFMANLGKIQYLFRKIQLELTKQSCFNFGADKLYNYICKKINNILN